jgi:hypothetical protein
LLCSKTALRAKASIFNDSCTPQIAKVQANASVFPRNGNVDFVYCTKKYVLLEVLTQVSPTNKSAAHTAARGAAAAGEPW